MHNIHKTPEERLAESSKGAILAIEKTTEEVEKVAKAMKGLQEEVKDKSVEIDGFIGIIKATRENTGKIDQLKDYIDHPEAVVRKLEEIKSASLVANKLLKDIKDKEIESYNDSSVVLVLKEIRDKEEKEYDETHTLDLLKKIVSNTSKEQVIQVEAPKVSISPQVVNVEAPIVNINTSKLESQSQEHVEILTVLKEDNVKELSLLDKIEKGIRKLLIKESRDLGMNQVGISTGGLSQVVSAAITEGLRPLCGASTNGQVVLTNANTWYAVPSTAPTSAYVLVATPETSVGTIRWAFANTGTPSTTNGNFVIGHFTVKLAANQVVYFGSSSGLDSVNFTTKII